MFEASGRARSISGSGRWSCALVIFLCSGLARPALAHHATGGRIPETLWEGLLSGLAHPVIELDHLVFVLGVGVWCALANLRWMAPALFVLGTWLGCAAHLAGLDVVFDQAGVALSLLVAGAAILWTRRPVAPGLAGFLALAGAFHGYAYGESIVGAQTGAIGAYLFGFALIQLALVEGVRRLYGRLLSGTPSRAARLSWVWASGSAALGGALLVLQMTR